jgi:hypothetical protein
MVLQLNIDLRRPEQLAVTSAKTPRSEAVLQPPAADMLHAIGAYQFRHTTVTMNV